MSDASAAQRSTAARLLKGTEYDEKAKEAATMLFTSAQALLQKGQAGSGSDLALYLIDTWSTRDVECSETERGECCAGSRELGSCDVGQLKSLSSSLFAVEVEVGGYPSSMLLFRMSLHALAEGEC